MVDGERASELLRAFLKPVPIVPVLVIKDPAHAVPVAEALVAGGLPVVEVTLRTPCAIEVIMAMSEVKNCVVGVGTLLSDEDVVAAKKAGAKFGVSPGSTDVLVTSCEANDLPLLAGVSSASEMMRLHERGYDVAKFFPAEASGGVQALRAFAGPMPQFHFCPTGGLNAENTKNYLALPNVICVGGSWIVPSDHLVNEDWSAIEKLAATGLDIT